MELKNLEIKLEELQSQFESHQHYTYRQIDKLEIEVSRLERELNSLRYDVSK